MSYPQSYPQSTHLFYGRENIMREIVRGVMATEPNSFVLVGASRIGKTAILRHLASEQSLLRQKATFVIAQFDCAWQAPDVDQGSKVDRLEALLGVLTQQVRFANIECNWPEIEGQATVSRRIWQLAYQLNQQEHRLILLLDNFAALVNQVPDPISLINLLRLLMAEAVLIVTTEQPLYDLGGELAASPLIELFTQRFLGLLEPEATQTWLIAYQQQFASLQPIVGTLAELTGRHPFLLRKLGDSLAEVEQMLPLDHLTRSEPLIGSAALTLLRLRLAEHGRPLFMALWQHLQNPPLYIDPNNALSLLEQLLFTPLAARQLTHGQASSLNWLINLAVVTYSERIGVPSYQIFSPLFAEFLTNRLTRPPAHPPPVNAPYPSIHRGNVVEEPIYEQMTKMEAALLRYFLNHSQSIVSTEQLLTDVWKRPDSSTRRVQEAIRRLRLQLEQQTPPIGIIENERGRGYRFVPAGQS
ncbi:MAG: winged helix-turn-helix domain-containing protein [Chloroflexi bacterium]|nr:winged helix-turn-helix domain-containing protein [Chloroflexota bacterium]